MAPCPLLACAPGRIGRALAAQLTDPIPLQGDSGEGDPDCAGSPGLPGPPGLPGQRGEEVRPGPDPPSSGQDPKGAGVSTQVALSSRGQFHSCPVSSRALWWLPVSWESFGGVQVSGHLAPLTAGSPLLCRHTGCSRPRGPTPFRPGQPLPLPSALLRGSLLRPFHPLLRYHLLRETFPGLSEKLTPPYTTPRTRSSFRAVHVSPSEDRVFLHLGTFHTHLLSTMRQPRFYLLLPTSSPRASVPHGREFYVWFIN